MVASEGKDGPTPSLGRAGGLEGSRLPRWVSPLLVFDEDLVEGGSAGGGQGFLHVLQEVGVHT